MSDEPQDPSEDELIAMSGEIVDMAKRFTPDGWGFGKLKVEGQKEPVKLTGTLEGFGVGQCVSITGRWRNSTKYGVQFAVDTILADDPQDLRGIRKWIVERLPQIGPVRAEEIAKKYGSSLWHVIETQVMDLTSISGITPQRAEEIAEKYKEYRAEQAKFVPYYEFGMTRREARHAMKAEIEPEQLKADPFVLYLQMPSIFSFRRVNHLSVKTCAPKLAPARLVAAAVNAVREASFDGHTAIDEDYLVEHACAEANISIAQAEAGLATAIEGDWLVRTEFDKAIALPSLSEAEEHIASKLHRLLKEDPHDHERDDPGPHPGGGSEDAPGEAGGDRDGPAGERKDHDPQDSAGTDAEPVEGGAGGADW